MCCGKEEIKSVYVIPCWDVLANMFLSTRIQFPTKHARIKIIAEAHLKPITCTLTFLVNNAPSEILFYSFRVVMMNKWDYLMKYHVKKFYLLLSGYQV